MTYTILLIAFLLLRRLLEVQWWPLAIADNGGIYLFLPALVLLPLAVCQRRWHDAAALLVPLAIMAAIYLPPLRVGPPPAGQPLTIATLNMWEENPDTGPINQWVADVDTDIVVLQEVREGFLQPGLYPHQVAAPRQGDRGVVVVLSRYPITSVRQLDIPTNPISDSSVLRVVIDVNGQPTAVYAVHLEVPRRADPRLPVLGDTPFLRTLASYDESLRNAQIAQLVAAVEDESLPVIAAGDFNTAAHSLMYTRIPLQDARPLRYTWPANPRVPLAAMRLDYVWHGPCFEVVEARRGPYLGSDHYPIITTLTSVCDKYH